MPLRAAQHEATKSSPTFSTCSVILFLTSSPILMSMRSRSPSSCQLARILFTTSSCSRSTSDSSQKSCWLCSSRWMKRRTIPKGGLLVWTAVMHSNAVHICRQMEWPPPPQTLRSPAFTQTPYPSSPKSILLQHQDMGQHTATLCNSLQEAFGNRVAAPGLMTKDHQGSVTPDLAKGSPVVCSQLLPHYAGPAREEAESPSPFAITLQSSNEQALTQHPVIPTGLVCSHKCLDFNYSFNLPRQTRGWEMIFHGVRNTHRE